jgi:hypothetical protein
MMASSSEDRLKIVQLKEEAKWAQNLEDMKRAVAELANYGEKAVPMLDEIKYVTVHEDVKSACIEAIKRITGGIEEQRQQPAEPPGGAAATADKSAAEQKDGEREKDRAKRKEKKDA